jgi:hypothetical protein
MLRIRQERIEAIRRRPRRRHTWKCIEWIEIPDIYRPHVGEAEACAWEGCRAAWSAKSPQGWHWLILNDAYPNPLLAEALPWPTDQRAILCPKHAKALDEILENLARHVWRLAEEDRRLAEEEEAEEVAPT